MSDNKIRLLRLRNTWGNEQEWNSRWSDVCGSIPYSFWNNPRYINNLDPNDDEHKSTLIVSFMTRDTHRVRFNNQGCIFEIPKQFRMYKVQSFLPKLSLKMHQTWMHLIHIYN